MALHILLVEDDPDLLREVQEYLVRRDHRVTAAGSHGEAASLLASAPPLALDVVLCDVNLGGKDGVDLYQTFAARRTDCRWILMSGDPDTERLAALRRQRSDLPSCVLIEKPVSLRRLTALLTEPA